MKKGGIFKLHRFLLFFKIKVLWSWTFRCKNKWVFSSNAFSVRFKELVSDSVLNTDWPTLRKDLEDEAEMVLGMTKISFIVKLIKLL
jgi:hypothetical protein